MFRSICRWTSEGRDVRLGMGGGWVESFVSVVRVRILRTIAWFMRRIIVDSDSREAKECVMSRW